MPRDLNTYLETIYVLALRNDGRVANAELVRNTNSRETEDPNSASTIDAHNLVLARATVETGLAEVLEEAVQSSACVHYDQKLPRLI